MHEMRVEELNGSRPRELPEAVRVFTFEIEVVSRSLAVCTIIAVDFEILVGFGISIVGEI